MPVRPNKERPTCVARVSETSAVTCDDHQQVVLWEDINPPNHPTRRKFEKDHNKKVAYVSVSTITNRVFAASFDGDVTVRNLLDPHVDPVLKFTKHYPDGTPDEKKPEVWVVTPSPDGARALSGANNGEIKYWDVATGNVLATFKDSDERVAALAFRPAGAPAGKTQFLSGHEDGKMMLWEFDAQNPAARPTAQVNFSHENPNQPVNAVAVSPDGKFAVSAGFDRTARIWNLETRTPVKVIDDFDDLIWRVAISPNGAKFAVASQDGKVRLFNLLTGAEFTDHMEELWGAMGVDFLSATRIVYTTADSNGDHIKTWDIPGNWP